jgi:glycosyltransferase involved in cell wall biosynthesis
MKFSIITPSYNQGRFLPDCVESVLLQTGVEFEHIVTDAGSTDGTLEVLSRHPHLQWTSEPDGGMSDGINKGFRKATGEWLMWLNCDDYLLPGTLEKIAAHAATHPAADVIHGDCVYVKEDKQVIRRKYDTPVDEMDLLFVGCVLPSTSTFYHRRVLDSGGLLDTTYRNCMDWEYYLRLLRAGMKFSYLPEALAHFRWYDESTTQKNWQRMIDEGHRCQREHLQLTGRPAWLGNASSLALLRRAFQCRRVLKRLSTHGRIK